jgi:hypothetical protein
MDAEPNLTDGDPRATVIARIAAERLLWRDLVAEVGEDRMNEPGPMGAWTFKDLASHLLGWRQRMIARIEAAAEGRPEPPTPWPSDLEGDDAINPWIRARDLDRQLRDVLDDIDGSYERLARAVSSLPEELVTRAGVFPWLEGDALAETELFGHLHDEHEASIRAWLASRG